MQNYDRTLIRKHKHSNVQKLNIRKVTDPANILFDILYVTVFVSLFIKRQTTVGRNQKVMKYRPFPIDLWPSYRNHYTYHSLHKIKFKAQLVSQVSHIIV